MLPKCYVIFASKKFTVLLIYSIVDPNGQSSQYLESTEYGEKNVELEKCSYINVYVNHIAPTLKNLQTYIKSHLSTRSSIRITHKLDTSSKE